MVHPIYISVNQHGEWTKEVCLHIDDNDVFNIDFNEDVNVNNDLCDDEHDEYMEIHNAAHLKFEFAEPSSFVAMKPPSSAFGLFLSCQNNQ